jgi:hypothetical protein
MSGKAQLVFASLYLLALAGIVDGCGSSRLLQCRAEAAAMLPLDPDTITSADVKAVARRVKACQASATPPQIFGDSRGDAGP